MRLMISLSAALLAALPPALRAGDLKLEYHGAGWTQVGRIEKSFTTSAQSQNDYNRNWMQNAGGQFTVNAKVDTNWQANMGLGTALVHLARGNSSNYNIWYPFWVPYVPEADIIYSSTLFTTEDKLRLTLGYFPFNYNLDVKNLGLYLLRGYVYPGTLVSGFGNYYGALVGYQNGGFKNDFLINSETEDKPLYDISVADIITYQVHSGLELGAGVNFYRLIPQNKDITSPGKDCNESSDMGPYAGFGQGSPCYILDTLADGGIDTLTGSLSGTKVMGRFRLDPKELFGFSRIGPLVFGKGDLVLYSEAAIIGLKNYKIAYDDIKRRIPIMVGFNFPCFGFLDYLVLEVERYTSLNNSDALAAQSGSWVPATPDPQVNNARDDWKWSVLVSKNLSGHIALSAQIANDHLRPGGFHNQQTAVEATKTPNDWYWTSKIAYFF